MTEKEKMLNGYLYDPFCEGMPERRAECHELCLKYNLLTEKDTEKRTELLQKILPKVNEGVYLQGPIQFDFGTNIHIGKFSYANFNFVVLDTAEVNIGENVFIGPNVTLATPIHPLRYQDRNIFFNKKTGVYTNLEYSKPIIIKDNCWICSNVVVIGGVTIGEGSVIGAGSVVTKDIPPHSLAAGSPCKVIRKIDENDDLRNHPELFL